MANRDANITIIISEDGMEARGLFSPPVGLGVCLGIEDVESALAAAGVSTGIDRDALSLAVEGCNKSTAVKESVIARGQPPEDADPAYLKLSQKLFQTRLYGKEHGGRVDFHEARPFIIVTSGESLGKYQQPQDGIPGSTVTGDPLSPGEKKRIPFEPGENTVKEGDFIKAEISGRFILEGVRFRVTPVLELSGVNFSTGNIRYPGDVLLTGEISDGFTLSCGGDLHSTAPLDVSDVRIKGDLFVEGGLLGRGGGVLKVGGNVSVRFIENIHLECRGTVSAEGGILQSSVFTLGSVICGEKGRIFNAEVHAVAGIEAQQLGNPSGQTTIISCGTDFRRLRSFKERTRQLRVLKLKADTLAAMKNESILAPGSSAGLEKLIRSTTAVIEEVQAAANEDVRGISGNPEARITVRDTIFPGVNIEICQVVRRVKTSIPRGTFYLDSEKNRIELIDT